MPQDNPLTLLDENEPIAGEGTLPPAYVYGRNANAPAGEYCATCPLQDIAIVYDPNGAAIDAEVDEYDDAKDLVLPPISGSELWSIDGLIDAYHRKYGDEELSQLLVVISPDGNGAGMGYTIERADHWFDRYDINHEKKVIYIDNDEVFSDFTNDEAAEALHDAISDIARHIAFENESFWGAVGRIAMGTVLATLGTAETLVGVVGILVPEPGTTAAGVAATTFGLSTAGEGFSMLLGANYGDGYNFLEEGFAAVGDLVGGDTGEDLARTTFVVVNLFVSLGGTVKILKVPNQNFIMRGHLHGANLRLANSIGDGFTVGRLQLMYRLRSGRVYVNITNNSNQWILRLQNVDGAVVINGRVINGQNWHRIRNPAEVVKMVAKLILHGF